MNKNHSSDDIDENKGEISPGYGRRPHTDLRVFITLEKTHFRDSPKTPTICSLCGRSLGCFNKEEFSEYKSWDEYAHKSCYQRYTYCVVCGKFLSPYDKSKILSTLHRKEWTHHHGCITRKTSTSRWVYRKVNHDF
jgi:hypothetical protein